MSLTPEEQRAVEAACVVLKANGTDGNQPTTNHLIEEGLSYPERTYVYGYLAGDRDGYRRGVEAAISELAALREERDALARQLERRADGMDPLTVQLRTAKDEALALLLECEPHIADLRRSKEAGSYFATAQYLREIEARIRTLLNKEEP